MSNLKEEILRLNQEVENYKILIEAFNPILNSLKEERRGK